MSKFMRNFNENDFADIKKRIEPALNQVRKSDGELDFQIRPNNRFNIYYRGNSLCSVQIKNNNYSIEIASSFEPEKIYKNIKFKKNKGRSLAKIDDLKEFFTKTNLNQLCQKIKAINYQEELVLQHKILSDNIINPDFFIIDREIQGLGSRKELDLLGLHKNTNDEYSLSLFEIKLVYNPDLKNSDVINQINTYEGLFQKHIDQVARSYELNYKQKKSLGLFSKKFPESITINTKKLEKYIILGGNYQMAQKINKKLERDGFDGKVICLNFVLSTLFD